MLISHKYKFITIDIPKTGTATLRRTFLPFVDYFGKGVDQHMNIKSFQSFFSENGLLFQDYLKFTIVRNPWHRYVSFCSYIFERVNSYNVFAREGKADQLPEGRIQQALSYKELIKHAENDEIKLMKLIINQQPSQYDYVSDTNGDIPIDMFATTENLNKDIETFRKKAGITVPLEIKYWNKSSRTKSYNDYYTQELIDMVAEKEKWVIDNFNYDYK